MRSKVDFQELDGDADSTKPRMEKYGVHGYPTLIYTDNSGKELARPGASENPEEFKQSIAQFVK